MYHIGKSDFACGLTYVALSRVTSPDRLLIIENTNAAGRVDDIAAVDRWRRIANSVVFPRKRALLARLHRLAATL